jgi:RNA polymerase sigma-70 factor (ECF subfamily)
MQDCALVEALRAGDERAVMQLHDVEGCSAEEVCEALGLSEVSQRVQLHRARSRVRNELARYLRGRTP